MLERILSIIFAFCGALMLYISLDNTVDHVGWVWLAGLIVGSQLVMMAVRWAVKS